MSKNTTYANNLKYVNDFDFDKELEVLAHSFKLGRLGKQIRETNKLNKEYSQSKTTHKKSKDPMKWM